MNGPTIEWMKQLSAEKRVILPVVSSSEENRIQAANGSPTRYYNRLIWMLPNGQYGSYDKRHLFGFAGEDNQYTAGTKRLRHR